MISATIRMGTALVLAGSVMCWTFGVSAQQDRIQYPDPASAQGPGSRDTGATAKLSPDLRILFNQFNGGGRGGAAVGEMSFSDRELRDMYGIMGEGGDPMVSLIVTMSNGTDAEVLKQRGMKVYMVSGNTAHGEARVSTIGRLATDRSVVSVASAMSARSPERPAPATTLELEPAGGSKGGSRSASPTAPLANEFNKAAMTGKGVIVGVIDSGIDFKHPDFIRPDGTSRILAVWDLYDTSFASTSGRVGTSPPSLMAGGPPLPGTIYTNEQINAALKGTGTVNTADRQGHGTAVAGTAAGNGAASGGAHTGVAPEADLLIVKASDCAGFSPNWHLGAAWIVQTAQAMKRPVVVNGSFGGHYSGHDGSEPQELFLNQISGKGKPGVVFTFSAGNEGQSSMHATGRFGPKRPGQVDISSSPVSVNIAPERVGGPAGKATIMGLFDARDEWGFAVLPSANSPLKDTTGKPMLFFIYKTATGMKWAYGKGLTPPPGFAQYAESVMRTVIYGVNGQDRVFMQLPAGSYEVFGLSMSDKVVGGAFSLYAPSHRDVDFGRSVTKTGMVGSPGNAANVITVGAYDFRSSWTNMKNTQSFFNLPIGSISNYSSPGGKRRDGVVKPDIAAPATYTISPLSSSAAFGSTTCGGDNMGATGESHITPDGKYIAWNGTSAASPFAAGVVALMLQKNPTLDAEQVREILIKTAGSGGDVGAVPNADWGYGRLEPASAIASTPAPGGATTRPPAKTPAKPAAKPPVKRPAKRV